MEILLSAGRKGAILLPNKCLGIFPQEGIPSQDGHFLIFAVEKAILFNSQGFRR
jgi:hypothetical protein